MICGHLNCKMEKNAITLTKTNIVMLLKSLSYIFLKVGENKVPLEF